jgi:cell wall assembly regulator SMI1
MDVVFGSVAESWARIDAWLAVHAPRSYGELNPPASEGAIAEAETRTGIRFPDDLRLSLAVHNGETSTLGVLPCGPLYSTDDIVRAVELRMKCLGDDPELALWWQPAWVPFSGADGDDHFIETSSGLWRDHVGYANHADVAVFTGWPSLGAWLHAVADTLENHGPGYFSLIDPPAMTDDGRIEWWG